MKRLTLLETGPKTPPEGIKGRRKPYTGVNSLAKKNQLSVEMLELVLVLKMKAQEKLSKRPEVIILAILT